MDSVSTINVEKENNSGMTSVSLRLIREHNRIYKFWMRTLWRFYGMEAPIVLMVHGFKPSMGDCKNAFEMTGVSFEKLMHHLINNGWHAMSYEELKEMVQTRQWKHKHFYLTFDDTYDTVYTEAYPILQRLQIPFTMFVTKGLVDTPGFITSKHLKELSQRHLCRIGCHGLEHKVFRNFTANEMNRQCLEEKKWLESSLGVTVDSFAFPYGRVVEVSNENRQQIRKMPFSLAFSAIEGSIRSVWHTGRHFLPRVNVSETFVERFIAGKRLRFKDCEGR